MKRKAARQGPSVCELEGPMPILKISNTEIASCVNQTGFDKFTLFIIVLCGLYFIVLAIT